MQAWTEPVGGSPGIHVPAGTPLPPGTTLLPGTTLHPQDAAHPGKAAQSRTTSRPWTTPHPARRLPPGSAPRLGAGSRRRGGLAADHYQVAVPSQRPPAEPALPTLPARASLIGPSQVDPALVDPARLPTGRRSNRLVPRLTLLAIAAVALSTTTTAAAAPNAAWPKGVDVSSWQHQNGAAIDWNAVKAAGNQFAVIKATESTTYTNPQFAADKAGAQAAGLVVGAYHYARPTLPISTAADQARHFLAAAGNTNTIGQLAPVLDLETTGGLSPADLTAWTQTFLRTVEAQTGRIPIIYTYRSFWTDKIANTQAFAKYPLWFAIYNDNRDPGPLPGGWQNWLIWQYDSGGAVSGINGRVDVNAFCCSATDLTANANGTIDQIAARYAAEPLLHISLGAPTRGEGPAGGGRWQPYANGLMFWSAETGARALFGPIAQKYLAWGGSNGSLGRPLEDISWTTAPEGLQAVFEHGRIYWHPALGAFVVHGEILAKYLADGGSGFALGLPISDEYDVPGGRESVFQHGKLIWNSTINQVTESSGTTFLAGVAAAVVVF